MTPFLRNAKKCDGRVRIIPILRNSSRCQVALEALTNYDWPGNIRELRNVIERSVVWSSGPELRVALPELDSKSTRVELQGGRASNICQATERAHILQVLKEAKGMVGGTNGAAARLGLMRTTLQSRMRKYKIARLY